MKNIFMTLLLTLSSISLFATNNIHDVVKINFDQFIDEPIPEDDEYCFSTTVLISGSPGPVSVGVSVTVTACGATPLLAFVNLAVAFNSLTEE